MLTQWLPTSPSPLPRQRIRSHSIWCISDSNLRYAFTQVGVGGIVLNSKVGCLDVLIDELIAVFRCVSHTSVILPFDSKSWRLSTAIRYKAEVLMVQERVSPLPQFQGSHLLAIFQGAEWNRFSFFLYFFSMLAMFCLWFGDVGYGKFKVGSSQAEKWIAPSAEISWDICESWVVSPVQVAWQIPVKISPLGGVHPVLS